MTGRLGWAWLLVVCWSGLGVVQAQDRPIRLADMDVIRDTLALAATPPYRLQPFIRPGTEAIYLGGERLDSTQYQLDHRHGLLTLTEPILDLDTDLVAVYQVWPFVFKDVYRRRRVAVQSDPDAAGAVAVVEDESAGRPSADPFGDLRLQRSGSITRGVIAGNNRDVTLESGLRMQLAGEVVDGVSVQAVLTDENTPIQPEGTTQRLNEFDRVFIQVQTQQGTAQLGDFDLSFQNSEFARFNRKLQGATVFGDVPEAGAFWSGGRIAVAGATSRGVYRTQDLEPIDGVQGPYRLQGSNNERFIIVIAGSETVYWDGQPLTRGETNDYVIDYATAEITFTSTRLVTADRRITVEFQYTTNQFTRTLVGAETETRFGRFADGSSRARLGATFIREADSRQFNEELGLTTEDSLLLAQAGDGTATRSGAEPVVFDPEAPYVQYTREPRTGPDGMVDTVFVAVTEVPADGETVYRVRFSQVGEGMGSYVRDARTVNGIAYRYVGEGQGTYAPIRLLPMPKQQQLLDLRGGFSPVQGVEVFGEWARSLDDPNRLSSLGDGDDIGDAYVAGIRIDDLDIGLGRLSSQVRRRFTGDRFTSFDRTRPVEFTRRWNLISRGGEAGGGTAQTLDETIDEADLEWAWSEQSYLRGEVGRIDLGTAFQGTRQAGQVQLGERGFPRLRYQIDYITSEDTVRQEDGRWLRQLGSIRQPLVGGRLEPRLEIEQERRRQEVLGTDSLAATSFAFIEARPGLAWISDGLELGGGLEYRTEEDWAAGRLRDAATAWTVQTNVSARPGRLFSTDATVGYRIKRYTDYFQVNERREDAESVVINWNGRYQPLQRAVEANWFYEALTERTPTLQEIYYRSGPELGEYVWEDINGDGLIQVDEMLPERTPNEGLYLRTFIPSDSLSSVINVQARLRLQLEPARLWRSAEAAWKRWLAQVSARTTLEVQEKSRDPELAQIYLLQLNRFRDSLNTLSGRLRVRQDLLLFRSRPRYGLDLTFNDLRSLSELAAGEEERLARQWRAEGRYKPSVPWALRLTLLRERERVLSEQFATRRFDIRSLELDPEVAFNPTRSLQVTGGAAWAWKREALADRQGRVLKVPVQARWARAQKLQATLRFEVANVRVDQPAGERLAGLAAFELTDGRGPGTSYLWALVGQYTINRYLRATLQYDGRAPADAPVLHTLRMQLSAVF